MSAALSAPSLGGLFGVPKGLHRDVHPVAYHHRELGLASKGALDVLHQSPAHYRTWVDEEDVEKETAALRVGSAVHCAMLEPARFAQDYVVAPDFGDCRFKDNKARRDAWREANKFARHVSDIEHAMITGMARAISRHPVAAKILDEGIPELTVRWSDPQTGVECKARADYHVARLAMVVDLKTCEDASPDGFRKSVTRYGYHRQNAFYARGFEAVGFPLKHFVFLAIEKKPPYALALYTLDVAAIAKGDASIDADLHMLAECLRADRWPGYAEGIQSLTLPEWAS